MPVDLPSGKIPLVSVVPPTWGELASPGEKAQVIRFVFDDRIVTYPVSQLKRWEHAVGEPEFLTIDLAKETVVLEGHELAAVRAALDVGRLAEVRANRERSGRPGPRIRQLTLEAA
jgi:hypothetical protein